MLPAGMSYGKFTIFSISAILSMFAGSQVVYNYYQPMSDLEDFVQRELTRRAEEKATATTDKGSMQQQQ